MMKKIFIVTGFIAVGVVMVSCKDKRSTGRAYMPDMAYSVAYETYTPAEERLKNSMVDGGGTDPFYNGKPVSGTIARGDMPGYSMVKDTTGMYVGSAAMKSPLTMASVNLKEAERLYLVNCGICHGGKLDGNGPLYNDGNGPYSAAPKNLVGDELKAMADGTMFHSITYGKGAMGSYASQLNVMQRWEVIAYIRSKQQGGTAAADSSATATDSTAKAAPMVKDSAAAQMK